MTTTARCATVDLAGARDAITRVLETAEYNGGTLRINEWLADVINPPCALIGSFNVTWEDDTFNDLPTATLAVRLVVPVIANRPAQRDLDQLQTAYAGALYADPTLGGVVRRCVPVNTIGTTFARGNQEFPCADATTLVIF